MLIKELNREQGGTLSMYTANSPDITILFESAQTINLSACTQDLNQTA
jgi:hypothetical protein